MSETDTSTASCSERNIRSVAQPAEPLQTASSSAPALSSGQSRLSGQKPETPPARIVCWDSRQAEKSAGLMRTPYGYKGCWNSQQGGRPENQDYCAYAETAYGFLSIVCDGMGGGPGGATASRLAVQAILETFVEPGQDLSAEFCVSSALRRANRAVFEEAQRRPELAGMGTTATVLLLRPDEALLLHVGDSRIYQFRRGRKRYRTFDHSMVFQLVKEKVITEEQARLSAQSNVITKALGIKPDLDLDPPVHLSYRKGDRFLLCTDGVCGAMPEPELQSLVASGKRPLRTALDMLFTRVNSIGVEKGGHHDNFTAILVEADRDAEVQSMKARLSGRILWSLAALVLAVGAVVAYLILKTK